MIGIKRKFTQIKSDEVNFTKKRKVNMVDFEEVQMKTAMKKDQTGNKENHSRSVLNSFDKMEIKRTSQLSESKFPKEDYRKSPFDLNRQFTSDRKSACLIKPSFSYSSLKTETRCNFKKSFEQIVKSNPDHKNIHPSSSLNSSYDRKSHRPSTSIDNGITKFHPHTEEKKRPVSFLKNEDNQTPKFPVLGNQSGEKKNYFIPCYKASMVRTEIQMKRTFNYF